MQTLKSRLQRWEQLSRYYVNKWHYDGSKFVERVWYGQGSQGRVAQVPFMITRQMRQQLEAAGFPGDEISRMLPKAAHQIITDKVTYARYVQQKQELEEVEALAEAAREALAKEEQAAVAAASTTDADSTTTSIAIVAAEAQTDAYLAEDAASAQEVAVTTSVAVVAQQEPAKP